MQYLAPLFTRARRVRTLGAVLALLFFCGPALADDPFDLESSSWMSFDRYKDQPSHWLAPDQRATVQAQPVVIVPPTLPASLPLVTDPTRPIETPVMPGVNKNFDIKVDSTEDDHRLPVIQPDKGDDKDNDGLSDSAWKSAVEAAKQNAQTNPAETPKNDGSSFNVRYTALPPWIASPIKTPAMTPVPQKPELPPVKIAQPAVAPPPPPPKPAVTPADVAACAALDAYKKHQLEAIESDRQTLTALQNAIAQLGLQKQLDFMTGASGSLSLQGSAAVKN